ncbi:replicative DNA helicase [Methylobacter sp. Wu8]|uniref:Replicative DNA helicase n=1 Tax=Methylobacter tundripaludum TaxID=173365 RepID=A0A2S6H4T6_9GAMM|nr:replicative DNA helicase [Methylobacter tundripaludum]MCF7967411.1 replicative DNA helicase [Methylobacter tundripaludum]PPK72474.1 primary replicative DNA helicase [Methylobacter tundripaludum]
MSENYSFDRDYSLDSLKIPPNSIQAEQSVLGGLMLDNQTWDSVADKVSEGDFYRRDHQLIFRTIAQLAEKQIPFDVITISESLEAIGELENSGGLSYLGMLAKDTPSAANIVTYANIVRDRSVLRQLIHVGTEIADSAFNTEGRETADLLENAERQVFKIAEQRQRGQGNGFATIKSLLATAVDKIETLFEQEGSITGAATGFTDFDELTSGLQPADLIIVAGRPSMGKTTIAMNMAENIAIKGDKPVAVFSMEMPGDSLAMRMMSSLGRIDQHRIRTGKLEDDEWPRLTSAINLLAETKLFIDDTPALTPTEVRSRARRLAREHGQLGLIVLDYLQLMQSPSSGDNRVQQISDISRGLKALAKELNVPVVALSQLNRNLEQRPNKRPMMSDLRESGAIEQDADLIVFVYRDEVYNEDSPDKGIAEVIIGKQRNGPLGTVRLTFLGQFTRFENFAGNPYNSGDYE